MVVHHLLVGTWTPPGAIFTFAFDDEDFTLKLIKRTAIPADEPVSWITFDHSKTNIYGAAMKKWSSFRVESPTSIVHQASYPMPHSVEANSPESDTRAIFLIAAKHPPFAVYCNPFYSDSGRGSIFAVSPSGSLAENIENFAYHPNSGVHCMVFDPLGIYLYSADLKANKIWVHKRKGCETAELELVGAVNCSDDRDHPRWLAMHPSGNFMYVLMETANRLCEYLIDSSTHLPVYTEKHYPLIPQDISNRWTHYRADVVTISYSSKYLFASSRGKGDVSGYLSCFKLSGTGEIERQICMKPTSTSGGHSNAICPSDWTDEWIALTDDQEGWLEVLRWKDETLECVSRIRIGEPGFGMNAIWYD